VLNNNNPQGFQIHLFFFEYILATLKVSQAGNAHTVTLKVFTYKDATKIIENIQQ
jgi:hypothetical protein